MGVRIGIDSGGIFTGVMVVGEVIVPLHVDEARVLARWLREEGIESVAISLMNSYAKTNWAPSNRVNTQTWLSLTLILCKTLRILKRFTWSLRTVWCSILTSWKRAWNHSVQEGSDLLIVTREANAH